VAEGDCGAQVSERGSGAWRGLTLVHWTEPERHALGRAVTVALLERFEGNGGFSKSETWLLPCFKPLGLAIHFRGGPEQRRDAVALGEIECGP